MDLSKKCELCGMAAVTSVKDAAGNEHFYCEHHIPSQNSSLPLTSEIDTKPKDYVIFAAIIVFIFVAASIYQSYFGQPGLKEYMRSFMGVFFLVFAFFKFLDLKGFVMSYVGYDLVARRWPTYGYLYPFIELGLAGAFLLNFQTDLAYLADIVVMSVGSVGVVRQLGRGSKIRCACLGSFVKLPLTTISLIEDVTMLGMGLISLFI
jgi:hypothetical protein